MTSRKIDIEGMSCGHCVKWVTDALMSVNGVKDAQVSLESRNAIVEMDETVATDEAVTEAIRRVGYTVVSVT
ncbi:MAG: heavy-metal-associated domain-containing protein [Nitrospinae bacterium]|nr:heavy-metal-associated domain-containing protein [Nitrospinota bacterium]